MSRIYAGTPTQSGRETEMYLPGLLKSLHKGEVETRHHFHRAIEIIHFFQVLRTRIREMMSQQPGHRNRI
jgi:hypothetical protein